MQYTYFSPELTVQSIYFEMVLLLFIIGILVYGLKKYRFFLWRFITLFFGVLFFESLTGALWINNNLGSYSYIYNDVSFIMTLTWTTIIMFFKMLYDKIYKDSGLLKEFTFVIITSSVIGLLTLVALKAIGIFSYSTEMQALISSGIILFGRPLEAIAYFPIFIFTVFSFYKYWELAMYNKDLFTAYKINYGKDLIIGGVVIFLIGYLMHPLLDAEKAVSYLYLLLSLIVALLITNYGINIGKNLHLFARFLIGSLLYATLSLFVLHFFLSNGLISFSQSILNTYPGEIASVQNVTITDIGWGGVLIVSYFVIAIVKYFKIVLSNKHIVLNETKMTFKGWKSFYGKD